MTKCTHCQGEGVVYLNYLDVNEDGNENQNDRWLPCANCNGSGKESLGEESLLKVIFSWYLWLFSGEAPKPPPRYYPSDKESFSRERSSLLSETNSGSGQKEPAGKRTNERAPTSLRKEMDMQNNTLSLDRGTKLFALGILLVGAILSAFVGAVACSGTYYIPYLISEGGTGSWAEPDLGFVIILLVSGAFVGGIVGGITGLFGGITGGYFNQVKGMKIGLVLGVLIGAILAGMLAFVLSILGMVIIA